MSTDRETTRIVRSWLEDGVTQLPDTILDAVLDELPTTSQRRATWWPARRLSTMNTTLKFGLAAAVVAVAALIGINYLASPSVGGPGPSDATATSDPTASPEPSASPPATDEPTESPAAAPPLTQSFTSTMHGISASYPEGWTAQEATEPWTESTFSRLFGDPHVDFLYDPVLTDHLFLSIASQPIGDSTPEDWVAEQMASEEGCTTTEPIVVDDATGLIGPEGCDVAVVTTAGRGYWISLYTSDDDPVVVAPYDRGWFEEVLAGVQLQPEDAVD
jgi:hypothetical protein